MAKRDRPLSTNSDSGTIIGAGVKFKGNLSSEGDIFVDSRSVGNLKSGGLITIGVNAVVDGNLSARDIKIAGELRGHVLAESSVEITETGRVTGNINCQRLAITSGAQLSGQIKMEESPSRAPEEDVNPGSIES